MQYRLFYDCFCLLYVTGESPRSKEPRPQGGALKPLKQFQLFAMCLIMMIFDVTLDQIRRNLIPHRSDEISILPKLSSPQLLPHFRKFLKHFTCRNTLQHPYDLSDRISRRKTQEQMHMVRRHPHFLNFKSMVLRNLRKYLSHPFPYITSLNPFPVFGRPDQMIFRIVNRMRYPPDSNEDSDIAFSPPWADAPFIPVHRMEFSGANFNKTLSYKQLIFMLRGASTSA